MEGTGRFRTIVVDDDADARFLMSRALDRSGRFEVVGEAGDGEAAVPITATLQPDVVLLDLNMPRVDGLEALPRVQAVCQPGAIIVVVSAMRSDTVAEEVTGRGAAAFLTKDPGYEGLVRHLLSLVDDAIPRPAGSDVQRWRLPADRTSGAQARRRLRVVLADWQLSDLIDDAELLATELINNAVVHASSDVLVTAERRSDALRIAVTDTGAGTPYRPDTRVGDTHGRGLMLVEGIASAWGTAVDGSAKTVWFDLQAS
jgi:CheY-like chemotaxis protein